MARPLALLPVALILTLTIACGVNQPPTSDASVATSTQGQPTPVPAADRQQAVAFLQENQSIGADWLQLQADFDEWRSGLASCDRTAMVTALREFSGEFNPIAQQARRLPRSSISRDLANKLIDAAEQEDAALRQLRDRWQPGNNSLFDALDAARSEALDLQNEVADDLSELRDANGEQDGADNAEFSKAFTPVEEDWDKFHQDYAELRNTQTTLTTGEISARLSSLLDQLGEVTAALETLPTGDSTASISDTLQAAAAAEMDTLQALTDTYQSLPSDASDAPDPALFDPVDETITDGEKAIADANSDLNISGGDVSATDQAALSAFDSAAKSLIQDWDSFHQDYDTWLQNGRGCDEMAATESLGEFAARASALAARVRNLPQAGFLSPLANSLVEAAEREEEAYRSLRNNWRPFGNDVYRGLERERVNAQQLRHQTNQGLRQLMNLFGIADADI